MDDHRRLARLQARYDRLGRPQVRFFSAPPAEPWVPIYPETVARLRRGDFEGYLVLMLPSGFLFVLPPDGDAFEVRPAPRR